MSTHPIRRDRPATYRVFVQGVLDSGWSDFLPNMVVSAVHIAADNYITQLDGRVTDQAGLFGVLNFLYDLGFPLVAVECLDPAPPAVPFAGPAIPRFDHTTGQPL